MRQGCLSKSYLNTIFYMYCKACNSSEKIVKSGILRGQQRYLCKTCGTNFTLGQGAKTVSRKSHQTTIIDVAKHLGIAPSTVSRALNNKAEINAKTRELIVQTAMDMDYRPNLLAQSLNSGETQTIGVIIPNVERPYFAGVLAGIQKVAGIAGYRVIICQSNENYHLEVLNVQTLIGSRVDGLLISHSQETENFDYLRKAIARGLPIVHFDRIAPNLDTPRVVQRDYEGSYELVKHLIEQGCKRIAILAGPEKLLISEKRKEGYINALKQHDIALDDQLIAHTNFTKDEALAQLKKWMRLPEPPDAIYTVIYINAIQLITEAKAMGIKVPEDLAFVGFGDEPLAEFIEPSLTAYNLFPTKMGETAARLLIDHIINPENTSLETYAIDGEIRIRNSSLKKS